MNLTTTMNVYMYVCMLYITISIPYLTIIYALHKNYVSYMYNNMPTLYINVLIVHNKYVFFI